MRTGCGSLGLIAIEQIHRLADLRADGCTVNFGIHIILPVGQSRQLVLVMADTGTQFPVPVTGGDDMAVHRNIVPFVLQRTSVHPVVLQTGNEVQFMISQQVVCPTLEHVYFQVQTVFQEIQLRTETETTGCLPLYFRIAQITQHQTIGQILEQDTLEISTGGIKVDTVVTAHIISHRKFGIVYSRHIEPTFIGQHPTGLDSGENAPTYTRQFETVFRFFTES